MFDANPTAHPDPRTRQPIRTTLIAKVIGICMPLN